MAQPTESQHPLVSVVLPVYEPGHYLVDALRSVLNQSLSTDQMQIAVVDDCSATADVGELIREVDAPRPIELYRSSLNRGLGGNWNRCLEIARGDIVHILHQDDLIGPGFYRRMLPPFARQPELGMAFCRHAFIDEHDRTVRTSHREQWFAGPLTNWLPKIAERQRIQCPAVLVRRRTYDTLGGYRSDLRYALDWEMWVRIAAHFDVWYEPRVLAFYRRHAGSETGRLRTNSKLNDDVLRAIEVFASHLPDHRRSELVSDAYQTFASQKLKQLTKSEGAEPAIIENEAWAVETAIERIAHRQRAAQRLRKQLRKLERRMHVRQFEHRSGTRHRGDRTTSPS